MANPYLPNWEYIPDGEPRQFGNRVYVYGSHDSARSADFCDYKLKVWSAPCDDLSKWVCHGDIFHTVDDDDHFSDTHYTKNPLFAPDVICKDGKYYLYAYIMGAKGAIGVSDRPEGPFKFLSNYIYDEADAGDDGIYNDAGVLVDDDNRVYVYYGYEKSHMNEINGDNMFEVIKGSYKADCIPNGTAEDDFFEASSPRKIGDRYYLIYSPKIGSRLHYAIADNPYGPFQRKGYIVDNGKDYPGGNNHGSICNINGQWYVFYHRMTNGTIMSRRGCVEKINILADGTIPTVEMTSLGFEDSLNPYEIQPAELACVMIDGGMVIEKDCFTRMVTSIKDGTILGYKYYDFGEDFSSKTMEFAVDIISQGQQAEIEILADDYENGEVIGTVKIDGRDGAYTTRVKALKGRHSIFFKIKHSYHYSWFKDAFKDRNLFDLKSFVFMK